MLVNHVSGMWTPQLAHYKFLRREDVPAITMSGPLGSSLHSLARSILDVLFSLLAVF